MNEEGHLIGVFGANPDVRTVFENSIAKKNEAEGIIVYQRSEAGKRFSFLDDSSYPDRIQGYSRIASISDYAYYLLPRDGKLTAADGELAVLIDSFSLDGSIEVVDSDAEGYRQTIQSSFKGMRIEAFPLESRSSKSSVIDLSRIAPRKVWSDASTLIYVDRSFSVKGVGVVVLGFVLKGEVSVHDKLRLIPGPQGKLAEVKGIQISDEDFDRSGRGIRVGLSLKGVELTDLEKTSWLDDASHKISRDIDFDFSQSKYYKQPTTDRDLHFQYCGELFPSRIRQINDSSKRKASLASEVPIVKDLAVSVIDLNSKPLRVAGGGLVIA